MAYFGLALWICASYGFDSYRFALKGQIAAPPTIAAVREHYLQYSDLTDEELAGAMHARFFPDMPRVDFDTRVQLKSLKPTRAELSSEAYRRGLLPPDKRVKYDKAVRRNWPTPGPWDRYGVDLARLDDLARPTAIGAGMASCFTALGFGIAIYAAAFVFAWSLAWVGRGFASPQR